MLFRSRLPQPLSLYLTGPPYLHLHCLASLTVPPSLHLPISTSLTVPPSFGFSISTSLTRPPSLYLPHPTSILVHSYPLWSKNLGSQYMDASYIYRYVSYDSLFTVFTHRPLSVSKRPMRVQQRQYQPMISSSKSKQMRETTPRLPIPLVQQ